jgi:hypothetical protein
MQKNKPDRDMVFAVEAFIVDLQCAFHDAMRVRKVTRKQLSEQLDFPIKDIELFFSDDCYLSRPHIVAQMAHFLGLKIDLKLVPR